MNELPAVIKIKETLKAANIEIAEESAAEDLWWVTLNNNECFFISVDKDFGIRIGTESGNPSFYCYLKEGDIDKIPAIVSKFDEIEGVLK